MARASASLICPSFAMGTASTKVINSGTGGGGGGAGGGGGGGAAGGGGTCPRPPRPPRPPLPAPASACQRSLCASAWRRATHSFRLRRLLGCALRPGQRQRPQAHRAPEHPRRRRNHPRQGARLHHALIHYRDRRRRRALPRLFHRVHQNVQGRGPQHRP